MMNTAKWGLAEVYRKMGNSNHAAILYEQVLEIQDTLKSRKAKQTAQELAAVYHDKEQEQTIMQQQAENTRQRYLLFSVLAVLIGLEYAARLLVDEPERTVAQIATDCGFGSSSYFSDRFHQHYGMSPSDFRTEAAKSGAF